MNFLIALPCITTPHNNAAPVKSIPLCAFTWVMFAQPLMDAGLGSIGALELQDSIAEHFGFEVPAMLAFDYPSVRSMSIYLLALQSSSESIARVETHTTPKRASMHHAGYGYSGIFSVGCKYPRGMLDLKIDIVHDPSLIDVTNERKVV